MKPIFGVLQVIRRYWLSRPQAAAQRQGSSLRWRSAESVGFWASVLLVLPYLVGFENKKPIEDSPFLSLQVGYFEGLGWGLRRGQGGCLISGGCLGFCVALGVLVFQLAPLRALDTSKKTLLQILRLHYSEAWLVFVFFFQ